MMYYFYKQIYVRCIYMYICTCMYTQYIYMCTYTYTYSVYMYMYTCI